MTADVPLRVELKLDGRVRNPETGSEFEARTTSLSAEDTFFEAPVSPTVGDRVRVQLEWPLVPKDDPRTFLEVDGTVVHQESRADSGHHYQVRFERMPSLVRYGERRSRQELGTPPLFRLSRINLRAFEYYNRLSRVREFVVVNYTSTVRLETAAAVAGMEATYFSDFFRRKVGVPFSVWLQHLRIVKAIEMMNRENHSITYIAMEVGFSNLRSFERAFRKRTELSPVQFKRMVRPS